MNCEKKSFLLYFDNYCNIAHLPRDQKGLLLDAIYLCAYNAASRIPSSQSYADLCEEMEPETFMAFRFILQTLQRDAAKWWEKQERYQRAAQRRLTEKEEEAAPDHRGASSDTYE